MRLDFPQLEAPNEKAWAERVAAVYDLVIPPIARFLHLAS
jgi:hypothetical protein